MKITEHNQITKTIADRISDQGHIVRADIKGYQKPDLIELEGVSDRYTPNITSTKGDQEYIFKAETENSINGDHVENEWKCFSENASKHSKKFILVVPKGCALNARQRAKNIDVDLDGIWEV